MTDQNNTLAVDLNEETRKIWDQNAAFWDENMGEGNDFQRILTARRANACSICNPARAC